MKPTATPSRLLDRLTAPYWTLRLWWAEQRLYRRIGQGDAAAGQQLLREAVRQSVEEREGWW